MSRVIRGGFIESTGLLQVSPEIAEDRAPTLDDDLLEAGVSEKVVPAVVEIVERDAKRQAFHLTARSLAWIGEKLCRHNSHSASVAAALGIHGDKPLHEIGAFIGISKQGMQQRIKEIQHLFPSEEVREKHRKQCERFALAKKRKIAKDAADWARINAMPERTRQERREKNVARMKKLGKWKPSNI